MATKHKHIIGYQIVNKAQTDTPENMYIPSGLSSFQIFKSREDATRWARIFDITFDKPDSIWELIPIRQGDIEEPAFISVPQRTMKMQHRHFKIGERVFNCNYSEPDLMGFGTIVLIDGKAEDGIIDEDTIVTLDMSENGNGETEEYGDRIYKIAPRISKKVGETVCYEHTIFERGHNYQFYMPANDENYHRFELGL